MTSHDRVLAAFAFKPPDCIPRFDSFWEFPESWAKRFGPVENLSDIRIWTPNEGAFVRREHILEKKNGWIYRVDCWGRTIREQEGAYFLEVLEAPIPDGTDLESIEFDPPTLNERYQTADIQEGNLKDLSHDKKTYCIFGKTGGPYLRTSFIRGGEQFLIDIAGDPPLARALADKMADHLIGIAREQIRRWSLDETGVWIYDDMAANRGPMFSPKSFEDIFLPAYKRMIKEYKSAGAKYVILHSDGNIMPILDMLVDAGIDGLNPLEKRAGMDALEIRNRYPKLILTGGMCNTDTLRNGPVGRIEKETMQLIDLGRNGGFVIGTHSIGPEIPQENFDAYHRACLRYGNFTRVICPPVNIH